jgi:hypothetical protein
MTKRAFAIALLLSAVACSGGTSLTGSSPRPTALPADLTNKPSVEITYPQEGADPVQAGQVLVALTVRAFELTDAKDAKNANGEGHIVYYLDADPIPTGEDASDVPKGAARAKASAMTSHTWKDVSAGHHTLGVQLVNNDDSPLDPPATDTVDITVGG